MIENKQELTNRINRLVVRGLKSGGKRRRVFYSARTIISEATYQVLKSNYGLKFKYTDCESFLNDYKIIRANFKTMKNVSRCDNFKIAIR